jgi:hypothetical protein
MQETTDIALNETIPPLAEMPKAEGDFEHLFQMLEELGPAPNDFMLGLSDPMLETENIFELEAE